MSHQDTPHQSQRKTADKKKIITKSARPYTFDTNTSTNISMFTKASITFYILVFMVPAIPLSIQEMVHPISTISHLFSTIYPPKWQEAKKNRKRNEQSIIRGSILKDA